MVKALTKPIIIIVGGAVVPKERPDVSGAKTHYSPAYTQWQKSAKLALQASIAAMPAMITQHFPLSQVRIEFEFHGCIRGNGDLDNSAGSWLDAMVKCGILSGDNVRKVNQIESKFFDHEIPVSAIIIYPNSRPISVLDPKLLRAPSFNTVKLVKARRPSQTSNTPKEASSKANRPKLTIVKDPKR